MHGIEKDLQGRAMSQKELKELVAALEQEPHQRKWSHRQFADAIGVNRNFWLRVRRRAQSPDEGPEPGKVFLGRVLVAFPHLTELVLAYMRAKAVE